MSHYHFEPRRFVLAEYADSDALLAGTTTVRKQGRGRVDTHSPYPIHGLEEALGLGRPKVPLIVLCGAIAGICAALSMMYYMNVFDFPINVGNRAILAGPAWVPITFELAILLGGCSSFFGVIALMRLPEPYHPVFEWDRFSEKSVDGFFLSVEVDRGQDVDAVAEAVRATGAVEVKVVEESER